MSAIHPVNFPLCAIHPVNFPLSGLKTEVPFGNVMTWCYDLSTFIYMEYFLWCYDLNTYLCTITCNVKNLSSVLVVLGLSECMCNIINVLYSLWHWNKYVEMKWDTSLPAYKQQ